jgi:hypothetical protein
MTNQDKYQTRNSIQHTNYSDKYYEADELEEEMSAQDYEQLRRLRELERQRNEDIEKYQDTIWYSPRYYGKSFIYKFHLFFY